LLPHAYTLLHRCVPQAPTIAHVGRCYQFIRDYFRLLLAPRQKCVYNFLFS
jgi:hypothetical protein